MLVIFLNITDAVPKQDLCRDISGEQSSVDFTGKEVASIIANISCDKSPGNSLSKGHCEHGGAQRIWILAMFYSLCIGSV